MESFIEIKDLVKKYKLADGKEIFAVNNINLEIEKGDIYGIMGLSGAGKSTLIRLLNRLEEPTSGQILVEENADSNDTDSDFSKKNILFLVNKNSILFSYSKGKYSILVLVFKANFTANVISQICMISMFIKITSI